MISSKPTSGYVYVVDAMPSSRIFLDFARNVKLHKKEQHPMDAALVSIGNRLVKRILCEVVVDNYLVIVVLLVVVIILYWSTTTPVVT